MIITYIFPNRIIKFPSSQKIWTEYMKLDQENKGKHIGYIQYMCTTKFLASSTNIYQKY